jgi:hypothetical protein
VAATKWTVIILASDGTPSVVGPFSSEYRATLWANAHETEETGWACHVQPLESPRSVT